MPQRTKRQWKFKKNGNKARKQNETKYTGKLNKE
jgi:hypothetical protein